MWLSVRCVEKVVWLKQTTWQIMSCNKVMSCGITVTRNNHLTQVYWTMQLHILSTIYWIIFLWFLHSAALLTQTISASQKLYLLITLMDWAHTKTESIPERYLNTLLTSLQLISNLLSPVVKSTACWKTLSVICVQWSFLPHPWSLMR